MPSPPPSRRAPHPPPCDWCPEAPGCKAPCRRFKLWVFSGRDPEVRPGHEPPAGLKAPDARAARSVGKTEV